MRTLAPFTLIASFLFATWCSNTNAQQQFLQYDRLFGGPDKETCGQMIPGVDGGYLIVGSTGSYGTGASDQNPNGFVVKVDANGEPEWRIALGTYGHDFYSGATVTDDGNYLIIGTRVFSGVQDTDMTLTKVSPAGDVLSIKEIGTTGRSEQGYRILAVGNGEYVVIASRYLTGGGVDGNFLVFRTDDAGNITWTGEYGCGQQMDPKAITFAADSTLLIAGARYDLPVSHAVLIKVALDGTLVWGSTDQQVENSTSNIALVATEEGGCYTTGVGGTDQLALARYDANGEVLWRQGYTTGSSNSNGRDMILMPDGSLCISAYIFFTDHPDQGAACILHTDTMGQVLDQVMTGPDIGFLSPRSLVLDGAEGLVFASNISSDDEPGDVEVVRTHLGNNGWDEPCQPVQVGMQPMALPSLSPGPAITALPPPTLTVTTRDWIPLDANGSQTICTITGMTESLAPASARCWPNPAHDVINYEWPGAIRIKDLSVYDAMGRRTLNTPPLAGPAIPIPDLVPGIHTLLIIRESGERVVLPFVVE